MLKARKIFGLLYTGERKLETFSDADYAGDKLTRKSTSGTLTKIAGAAVMWQSQKQQTVALSTTEAEYVSAATAAKDIIWIYRLLTELVLNFKKNVLYVDNMSAIKLLMNPEFHQRTKHIDVKYHFVRDLVEDDKICVEYVASESQFADILTKALPKNRFVNLRLKLGLVCKNNLKLC